MSEETGEIVNRVAKSGLVTFNPEDHKPKGERVLLDIKDQLFQGLILKEKDFRAFVKDHDWSQYEGKFVAITCSTDAIVPAWAYMLLTIQLQPAAKFVHFGTLEAMEDELMRQAMEQVDFSEFEGGKIVVKGCGGISTATYVDITRRLRPYAQIIMYGEPCSTVPLFKRKKAAAG